MLVIFQFLQANRTNSDITDCSWALHKQLRKILLPSKVKKIVFSLILYVAAKTAKNVYSAIADRAFALNSVRNIVAKIDNNALKF